MRDPLVVESPSNQIRVGAFTISASSSEDIIVDTISITGADTGGSFYPRELCRLSVYPISEDNTYCLSSIAGLKVAANLDLLKGHRSTEVISITADVGSGITAGDWTNIELEVSGVGADSGTVYDSKADGQKLIAQ